VNDASWHVCVLVPARNEEELLPRCLVSILKACERLPADVTYDIVVCADRSTDRTLQAAESYLSGRGEVVTSDAGAVGFARALAVETALQRYSGALQRCWLANTDADCCVPETWLVDQLALANNGVEAIAGTVDVDCFSDFKPGVAALFSASYIIHADGSHPHVHGANLGVRADAYVRAGGWASLRTAEDHDLWNRLMDNGARRASVGRMKVITSGRRQGRAPLGFAGALALHNEALA
jgi:glycosyltransferase involved in cell wall biosynthesis